MSRIVILGAGSLGTDVIAEKLEKMGLHTCIDVIDLASLDNIAIKDDVNVNAWKELAASTKVILNENKIFKEPKRNFVNKFNKNKHR